MLLPLTLLIFITPPINAAEMVTAEARVLSISTETAPEEFPLPRAGWVQMTSSLLLYNSSGTLIQEVGQGQWDEERQGIMHQRTVRGKCSKDGRFAWAWEKNESVAPPARPGATPSPKEKSQHLSFMGSDGQEFWHNDSADAPAGMDPAVFSDSGETLLVIETIPDGWTVAAFDFLGNRLIETHDLGTVELAILSPRGRYGLVRWHPPNQLPTYTVLDLAQKIQKRMALPAMPPDVILRIDDSGRVWAQDKLLVEPKEQ